MANIGTYVCVKKKEITYKLLVSISHAPGPMQNTVAYNPKNMVHTNGRKKTVKSLTYRRLLVCNGSKPITRKTFWLIVLSKVSSSASALKALPTNFFFTWIKIWFNYLPVCFFLSLWLMLLGDKTPNRHWTAGVLRSLKQVEKVLMLALFSQKPSWASVLLSLAAAGSCTLLGLHCVWTFVWATDSALVSIQFSWIVQLVSWASQDVCPLHCVCICVYLQLSLQAHRAGWVGLHLTEQKLNQLATTEKSHNMNQHSQSLKFQFCPIFFPIRGINQLLFIHL